jgi:RNase P subunit RPR2
LEYARQMQKYYTERVEELLRIAEETFNQVENQ